MCVSVVAVREIIQELMNVRLFVCSCIGLMVENGGIFS